MERVGNLLLFGPNPKKVKITKKNIGLSPENLYYRPVGPSPFTNPILAITLLLLSLILFLPQFVIMGGSASRIKNFAFYMLEELNLKLPTGQTLVNLVEGTDRYVMYKTGPVLCVNVSTKPDQCYVYMLGEYRTNVMC